MKSSQQRAFATADLNDVDPDGRLVVNLGQVRLADSGADIDVWGVDDGQVVSGRIVHVDVEAGVVLVEVDWSSARSISSGATVLTAHASLEIRRVALSGSAESVHIRPSQLEIVPGGLELEAV